ncbi:NAD(P)H-binding protein [Pendulispora albinea]|uniref:NAD(P)H-binding protein n=1 Tax=Pendulispora albinea TaxID=2741071 RepID=A0ABZ2LPS5_9BACT
MNDTRTMAVFGATGKVGGRAVAKLRARGLRVRAVLRDASKGDAFWQGGCEVALADLYDAGAVARALAGADGALFVCPLRLDAPDVAADAQRIIEATAQAIEAARPRHVVAISDYGAHVPEGTGITMIFRRLEARLGPLPVATTFVRSAEHMQNWKRHLHAARARGVLPSLHHPLTKLYPTVSAFDVGDVAADLLAAGAREGAAGEGEGAAPGNPRVVHVEGPQRYSSLDLERAMEAVLGRPVRAQAIPREGWASALAAGGLAESYAGLVMQLFDAHNAGRIDAEPGAADVRRGTTELSKALGDLLRADA